MKDIPTTKTDPYEFAGSRFREMYYHVGATPKARGTDFNKEPFDEGAGYPTGTNIVPDKASTVATSVSDLRNAIDDVADGGLIWIPNWVTLDVTGVTNLTPAKNVTIASGSCFKLAPNTFAAGAELRIYDEGIDTDPIFDVSNPGVRFSGLRFNAPRTTWHEWQGYDDTPIYTGIAVNADNVEIDLCTFTGFTHAGVAVGEAGRVDETHIHHCDFVDNPQDALGYGVTVFHGRPLIQYSYFDHNRHSVSADGAEDCEYVVRYNIIGPNPISHQVDMHGDEDHEVNGRPRAGRDVSVHHNIIEGKDSVRDGHNTEAIKIRGQPLEGLQVVRNWFGHGLYRPHFSKEDGAAVQLEYGGVGENWVDRSYDGVKTSNIYGIPDRSVGVGLD